MAGKLSELRVAILDPPSEPDPRMNGFSSRYRLLMRFLAEECGELLAVLLDDNQSKVDRRARNLPSGATSIPLLLEIGSESRARRLSKATMSLLQIRSRPTWDRELEMQVRAWTPDVVVAPILPYYPPAYRQYVRPVMSIAPTILFLEEDGLPYGYAAKSPQAKALRHLELWAERRIVRPPPAVVVVISERERGWAEGIYPRSPVRVIPHGLDDDYWDVAPTRDQAASTSRDVFTICRLGSERSADGIVQISHALARIEAQGVRVPRLVVASSDEPHPTFSKAAHGVVDFLGPVDDPRRYYRSAGATLVPSFVVYGAKTTILQGWATKCPVVTTTNAAASVDGTPGVDLLAGESPDEVAEHLVRGINDPAASERIAEAGLSRYQQLHREPAIRAALRELVAAAYQSAPIRPSLLADLRADRSARNRLESR